jgi:hypothetical protein
MVACLYPQVHPAWGIKLHNPTAATKISNACFVYFIFLSALSIKTNFSRIFQARRTRMCRSQRTGAGSLALIWNDFRRYRTHKRQLLPSADPKPCSQPLGFFQIPASPFANARYQKCYYLLPVARPKSLVINYQSSRANRICRSKAVRRIVGPVAKLYSNVLVATLTMSLVARVIRPLSSSRVTDKK